MTIMIGAFVGLHGVLCSRSTRSRRSEAENHQELQAGVREAAEILLAIVSTGGARAAVDGPGGPLPCASSARRVRGSGCCPERRLGCLGQTCCLPGIGGGWGMMGHGELQDVGSSHAGSERWARADQGGYRIEHYS